MTEPSNQTPPAPPSAPPPVTPEKKKGLSPLAWVGIGCLVILLIGAALFVTCSMFVAKKAQDMAEDFAENPALAAAEMAVRMNPDLEMVESDPDAGTLTIREKSTGKVATFDWSQIEQGEFSFRTDEGEMDFDMSPEEGETGIISVTQPGEEGDEVISTRFGGGDSEIPGWVVRPAGQKVEVAFTMAGDQGESGMFSWTSSDSFDEVVEELRQDLEGRGFEVQLNTITMGDSGKRAILTGRGEDGERTYNATVGSTEKGTEVMVQYSSEP